MQAANQDFLSQVPSAFKPSSNIVCGFIHETKFQLWLQDTFWIFQNLK